MSKVLEVLNRDNWIQGVSARDAAGNETDISKGVKFCLVGAIGRAYTDFNLWLEAAVAAANLVPEIQLSTWNDKPGRTWEEVESLIKEAGI